MVNIEWNTTMQLNNVMILIPTARIIRSYTKFVKGDAFIRYDLLFTMTSKLIININF